MEKHCQAIRQCKCRKRLIFCPIGYGEVRQKSSFKGVQVPSRGYGRGQGVPHPHSREFEGVHKRAVTYCRQDEALAPSGSSTAEARSRCKCERLDKGVRLMKYGHLEEQDQGEVAPTSLGSKKPQSASMLRHMTGPRQIADKSHTGIEGNLQHM